MGIRMCGTPCSWGIDTVDNPRNPDWKRVVREAHEVGYKAIELGPYGYVPVDDVAMVSINLQENRMGIIAGVIFDELLTEARHAELKKQVDQICRFVSKLPALPIEPFQKQPAPYITLMDFGHEERNSVAGHSALAPRANAEKWNRIVSHIRELAAIAQSCGVRPVIHPHSGGYIEFEDEIERIMNDIPEETAGLCLDTGHCTYAGMDAAAMIRKYKDRLEYVHFKDINGPVYQSAMQRKLKFLDACHEGAFYPIGQGIVNYPDVIAALHEIKYNGYICIEQERDAANADEAMKTESASIQYLKSIGFEI